MAKVPVTAKVPTAQHPHCMACGVRGPWKEDAECPMTAPSQRPTSSSSTTPGGIGSKDKRGAHQVFFVRPARCNRMILRAHGFGYCVAE